MKKNPRRVSLLLAAALVLGLFAAFPVMTASAADTNYALNVVPGLYSDEACQTAVKGSTQSGTTCTPNADGTPSPAQLATITDGGPPASGQPLYFSANGLDYYALFNLGAVKTDLQSVYVCAMNQDTGNRKFPDAVRVYVSNDSSAWTEVTTVAGDLETVSGDWASKTYAFTAEQSAQYVKVYLHRSGVLSFGEIEIRNYDLHQGEVTTADPDPALVEDNYAFHAQYTTSGVLNGSPLSNLYRDANLTDSGSLLTDGYQSPSPSNSGCAGYTVGFAGTGAEFTLTFTLEQSHNDIGFVKFVNVPVPSGTSYGNPEIISIKFSDDGINFTRNASTITETEEDKGTGGPYDRTYSFAPQSGKYVQVTFKSPMWLVYLDEVVIGAGAGAPEPPTNPYQAPECDSTVTTSTAATNYAAASNGTRYAYSKGFPMNTNYKDDAWTCDNTAADAAKFGTGELNDGVFSEGSFDDAKWVGFDYQTKNEVELIFAFAHLYGDIDQIRLKTLAHGNDLDSYEKVESITVSFGDINGTYGEASAVSGYVTEEGGLEVNGKVFSRYTSQFAVAGPTAGARYVKISIPKTKNMLFIDEIEILGASEFEAPEPPVSFDPGAEYAVEPQFEVSLSAEYGAFDADKDATNGAEFTGIAVTVSVVNITYPTGIFSLEGRLHFDNTKLTPLYVSDEDLNDDTNHNPKPVLTWPTITVGGGAVFNIDGNCKIYSKPDGSTPAGQTFTKPGSYMDFCYLLDDIGDGEPGVTADNAMQLRYYFFVAEGQEGSELTFTVPDSPQATDATEFELYAFARDKEHGEAPKYFWNQPGKGGTCSVTVPVAPTEFTVTFVDWNGTTLKTETVASGNAATAPAAPAREGYNFTGWDVEFGNVTSDLTVTAQYARIVCTVTFMDADDMQIGEEVSVNYGDTVTPPAAPVVEGRTFTGWTADNGQDIGDPITEDVAFTATYEIKTYTVTFKDWNDTVLKTEQVAHGNAATAPADPAREGYNFTGWDVPFSNVTSDLTVTAQYEAAAAPPAAEFFVFKEGAVTTYVKKTDTYLIIKDGVKTAQQFIDLFADPEITLKTKTGTAVTSMTKKVSTGGSITSTINGESKTLTIVTVGDVNGDAKITLVDYARVRSNVQGSTALEGAFLEAAKAAAAPAKLVNLADYAAIRGFVQSTKAHF